MSPITKDMHSRAILVSLRISAWNGTKYDRKVSDEVAELHGASKDAGRYNAHLMPKGDNAFRRLQTHLANIRTENYSQTLSWTDDGWRLLPIKNHASFTDFTRNAFHKADTLLSDFVQEYPNLIDDSRRLRNGMHKDSDFPKNIASKFSWGMEFNPVPSTGDYRVELSDEEIAIIADSTEKRITNAFQDAQQDAVKRLYECVSKINERLADPKAIFRDSLIYNARELADVLKRLNIADDPHLEEMRRETELLAGAAEPSTLRDAPDVRLDTANKAQSILDSMQAVYGASLNM